MTDIIKRTKISFASGGMNCTGYLYFPSKLNANLPCVVMGSGFGGTQDTPSIISNATSFAESGIAALTFDYRSFGESDGEPRQLVSIKGQVEDFHAAIHYVRNHDAIDPEKVVLWGSSLGGGHVITVAAKDSRLAAVLSQIPFNGFPKQVEGRSSKDTRKIAVAIFKDKLRGLLGRAPHYIPAVGNTGELAVMASSDAKKTIDVMTSKHWRNEVAPRALLEMMRYKPSNSAHLIKMPVLVSMAEFDQETVGDLTKQIVVNISNVTLKSYPVAHFDFYRSHIRQQVISDQITFLHHHLIGNK
ncbi:alpha/beta hydrolase [Paenibacillus sp. L3-i20]|uniref:alpha/beta hydrolase n=1 Tax=Paenibacillus sp. L3-i20 TaxID=2905833 RepID=UPI001EDD9B5B|nr:alpha/beta fold hydrolase [Paenibacillus sp. L3-i20]GKU77330.1 alpha/beta hydrolase [Paenibacillus sp. L3-i20]